MVKTLMMSAALSALMITGALAQASPPLSQEPAKAAPTLNDPKFISAQGTDHWVYSKFKGTSVLGPDNAHIGDVSDMLFDKNGKILGLVVGVGGFLGMGQKNVAIDMSAFQVVPYDTGAATTGGGGNAPSVTANNDPTQVKLKVSWTKDQLKQAPDFQYYKAPARTTSTGPGGSTTGMAPRPTAPTAPRQ